MDTSYEYQRRCKNHLHDSNNSLKELSGMSSHEELIPEQFYCTCKNPQKLKIRYFENEFLSSSSYLAVLICSEIESLSVLKVFCTIF